MMQTLQPDFFSTELHPVHLKKLIIKVTACESVLSKVTSFPAQSWVH